MERVVFAGIFLCEVGIALPVRIELAVVEARVAIGVGSVVAGDAACGSG